jgi:hypothetical protein
MVIKEVIELRESSQNILSKVDFSDTFSTTNHVNSIEEIAFMIFNTSPKWVEWLFKIRNFLVRFVGLKTAVPETVNEKLEVGGHINFFQIYRIEDDEIIMGANDKHLNFRAVITNYQTEEFNIKVTTLVEYNNRLGRVYMSVIKPFHELVVKRMVKQAFKK